MHKLLPTAIQSRGSAMPWICDAQIHARHTGEWCSFLRSTRRPTSSCTTAVRTKALSRPANEAFKSFAFGDVPSIKVRGFAKGNHRGGCWKCSPVVGPHVGSLHLRRAANGSERLPMSPGKQQRTSIRCASSSSTTTNCVGTAANRVRDVLLDS